MAARKRAKRKTKSKTQSLVASQLLRYSADAGFVIISAAIAVAFFFAWFARDLPETDNLWRTDREASRTFLARDLSPLPKHGVSSGEPIRLSELPLHVPQAVLAVEDRNFYHHIGVNPFSVGRAIIVNATSGEVRQGGSTITQQLAKNLFLSSDRTLKRKIQELMLALWLEHRFTKAEILTLYLNRVYFGAGAYGIDAASYRYFNKSSRSLTITESAILAGLLKAPSKYAPTHNQKDASARARIVIQAMIDAGFLTMEAANEAVAAPVRLEGELQATAPYLLDYSYAEANKIAKNFDADLIIETTLDRSTQAAMEKAVALNWPDLAPSSKTEFAIVILDREGAVRGMVGGKNYRASQFNRAVQAKRQPGSAFKPFVYLAAFEYGATPDKLELDAPIKIGKWEPNNYNGTFYGEVSLKDALARSMNSVAVRVQENTGRNAVRLVAKNMGIDVPLNGGPSLALGVDVMSPLTLAGAYVPFANGGYRVKPHAIRSIRTADGDYIYHHTNDFNEVAASIGPIDDANELLKAVTDFGTGRKAQINGKNVYGKTGTTQSNRDAWFAGHVDGFTCVVWVGNDDNSSMGKVTGGSVPAILWREVMTRVLQDVPQENRNLVSVPQDFIMSMQKVDDPVADLLGRASE